MFGYLRRMKVDTTDRRTIFKYTFISSCLTGFICYLYFMANNLDNYDSIVNKPSGYGSGVSSGRWFLSVLGIIFDKIWHYNSSYFNCILAIILLGFINVLLVHIFRIRNKCICILLSAITIVFPPIADTMFFAFTIHYYMLAILLGLAGAYFVQNINTVNSIFIKIFLIILSGTLYACSLGIYQAYYPFIAVVLVLSLVRNCLEKEEDWRGILEKAVYYFISLLSGYVIYRIVLTLCLYVFKKELTDYKGINNMGNIDLKQFPELLYNTYSSYLMLFKEDFISINANLIAKVIIFLIFICVIFLLFFAWRNCGKLKFAELCILIAILPLASNSIIIMVPESDIRTMMSLGTISIFYLPLIFVEKTSFEKINIKKNISGNIFTFVFILAILNYTWLSNVNYNALYYANKKTENYFGRLYCRIESVEDYNENMPVIFIGKTITDAAYNENWTGIQYYGGNYISKEQINLYSRKSFVLNYLGRDYLDITEEQYQQYKDEIDKMAKYPNDKSIKVIDGSVFVKLE